MEAANVSRVTDGTPVQLLQQPEPIWTRKGDAGERQISVVAVYTSPLRFSVTADLGVGGAGRAGASVAGDDKFGVASSRGKRF